MNTANPLSRINPVSVTSDCTRPPTVDVDSNRTILQLLLELVVFDTVRAAVKPLTPPPTMQRETVSAFNEKHDLILAEYWDLWFKLNDVDRFHSVHRVVNRKRNVHLFIIVLTISIVVEAKIAI